MTDINKNSSFSIEEAANHLNVSTATIRNWIKSGSLLTVNRNFIPYTSIENMKNNIIGTIKLTKRANKSYASTHNHDQVSVNFLERVRTCDLNQINHIGEEYESSLSSSYRNIEGIYYTPPYIAKKMLEDIPGDVSNLTFLDPCCGSGNFLIAALERGFKLSNIFGYDIDPVAVSIARARIKVATQVDSENILVGDFLEKYLSNDIDRKKKYDIIFTNPPWGKKISKAMADKYSKSLGSSKKLDTAEMFFLLSLNILEQSGYLGMLLPDAFFNIASFSETRGVALRNKIISMTDFDKPFKGLMTKVKSIVVTRTNSLSLNEGVICRSLDSVYARNQSDFCKNPKKILNFLCNSNDAKVISTIFQNPHKLLYGNAKWGLGIVTGNNEKYVLPEPGEGLFPVYKGSEIMADRLLKPKNYISLDFSLYQQTASKDLYFAEEKLIYRFISSRLVFYCDRAQNLILNSANLVIPDKSIGVDMWKIAWLFNTDIMNWLFQKIFETHKILRSDLECLPIFDDYLNKTDYLSEIDLLNYLNIRRECNGTYTS